MEILLQGGWPGFSVNTKQNYEVNTHNIRLLTVIPH